MNQGADHLGDGEASHPAGKGPAIDSALLRRVAGGDPQASAAFLAAVHDRACRMVQEALSGPDGRRSPAVERLIRAYRRDDLQIQAALLSAQTSFRRHLLDLAQAAEVNDDRDYVTALISLTYNRWQRQHYAEKKACREAALGASGSDGDGEGRSTSRLDRAVDPRPGPDHRPILDDFYEKLVEEIHLMSSGLKRGEAEIVYLRLFQGMTYEQIAREVGVSIATVGRICQQVVAHLRRRFRDSAP